VTCGYASVLAEHAESSKSATSTFSPDYPRTLL
jgi:hypothetical protein